MAVIKIYTQHQKQEPHTKLPLDPPISHLPVTAKLLQKILRRMLQAKEECLYRPRDGKEHNPLRNLKVSVSGKSRVVGSQTKAREHWT